MSGLPEVPEVEVFCPRCGKSVRTPVQVKNVRRGIHSVTGRAILEVEFEGMNALHACPLRTVQ